MNRNGQRSALGDKLSVYPELGQGSGAENLSRGMQRRSLPAVLLPPLNRVACHRARLIFICKFPHGVAGGFKDLISWDSLNL